MIERRRMDAYRASTSAVFTVFEKEQICRNREGVFP